VKKKSWQEDAISSSRIKINYRIKYTYLYLDHVTIILVHVIGINYAKIKPLISFFRSYPLRGVCVASAGFSWCYSVHSI
jgi:hypothetical protein